MIQLIIARHDLHLIHEVLIQHRLQDLNLLDIELESLRLKGKEVIDFIDLNAHIFILVDACAG